MPAPRVRRVNIATPHRIPGCEPPAPGEDLELDAVEAAIVAVPGGQELIGDVLRNTYDQLYDGQHTGRFRWEQLMKTEKTHMGTIVEINLQRAFQWHDGDQMDYKIAGVDVDCKFSQSLGGWEIPIEARDGRHICLVVWANEELSRWEAGLIRVEESSELFNLDTEGNRDGKRRLRPEGESRIRWLYPEAALPENQLLHLDAYTRDAILEKQGRNGRESGQARINELFRRIQGRIVSRATVLTVARQDDGMKRPRDARKHLRRDGIIILGHQENDPLVAQALGLPAPRKGEFIGVRVVPAEPGRRGPAAEIGDELWRVATEDDDVFRAPEIPRGASTK